MNITRLNTLNDDKVIVRGNGGNSGGGGTTPSKPKWTGHADAEGLKAIGWTDEDIAYYQENGVNWNEEDDQYHKVSEDNKALYGVLTANNVSTYKDRIVYLPKIDTSAKTSMKSMFSDCRSLVAIPHLDTTNVTDMSSMFYTCHSLVAIPQLDTQRVTNMYYMFGNARCLSYLPKLDTSRVENFKNTFVSCWSLPYLDIDCISATECSAIIRNCGALQNIRFKNVRVSLSLTSSSSSDIIPMLSKDSMLFLINNERADNPITITLKNYNYSRFVEDADIVAALANHPNISLASA